MSYLSKLRLHKETVIIKSTLNEVSIYRTYNWICMLHINDQNDLGCMGFEPALEFAAEELKQGALSIRPRRHFLN